MKAKMDKYGQLSIDRGIGSEQWKFMGCPFIRAEEVSCGDWCPHFDVFLTSTTAQIIICHDKRIMVPLESFTDERP